MGLRLPNQKGISLSQIKCHEYVKESKNDWKQACSTPIESNHRLIEGDSDCLIDVESYQHLFGRLIYLSLTRPDITYAMGVVSQLMHAPTQAHMTATYRVLRYLQSYPRKGLLYQKYRNHRVVAYTDVD